ncbi:MAG TPA: hypothetical protein VFU15_11990 [Bacteroidia bacterium]|nr:hypothetical protein [Bacteroidia bacterium]
MQSLTSLPDWITALIGGFVTFAAKTAYDKFAKRKENKENELEKLHQLQEILREGKSTLHSQNYLRARLNRSLEERFDRGGLGYNQFFAKHFSELTPEEKTLFDLIRGISENSMYSANKRLLEWANAQAGMFAMKTGDAALNDFRKDLSEMKDHLVIWMDKYSSIFKKDPAQCLVYLKDEEAHGKGFPQRIEVSLATLISKM